MTRLFAAVGVIGLTVGVAWGDPAPVPSPAADLVSKLGSDDFATREAAVKALEKAGPGALPALRAGLTSSDPEVRARVAPIIAKLQRTTDSSAKLAPKKLALNYKDVSLGTALSDFKFRSGLNVVIDPNKIANPLRRVTCATGELPVWEALDAFCTAAGLKEEFRLEFDVPKVEIKNRRAYTPPPQVPNSDAVPITLIDGKGQSPVGDRRTAVRVIALPANFPGHRVTLGTGETTLCFDVAPMPGLNWLDVSAVKVSKLTDSAGRAGGAGMTKPVDGGDNSDDGIVVWGGAAGFGGPIMGRGGMRFDPRTGMPIYPDTVPNPRIVEVPLKLATPSARTIKRLEGAVLGEVLLTNQALLTLADPTKATGVAHDGLGQLRLTVQSVVEAKGGGTQMQVMLQYPSPWAASARRGFNPGGLWPEAPRSINATPSVQAFDAAGKAMGGSVNSGYSDSSDDGQTMYQHITLSFRKDSGTPAKLVVTGPRAMAVEVPFVLENVPLP